MLRSIVLFTCLISLSALAGNLSSNVKSTLPDVELPNAHAVGTSGQVFRSMQPMEHMEILEQLGIDEVLIFKHQTSDEVDREKVLLKEFGISRIHHIPFAWKNFSSLEEGCGQLMAALRIIKRAQERGRHILFHCTVGEDRTGALAGLWRMLQEGESAHEVFQREMCARGYSNGNRQKPLKVTSALEKELTPLFFAMAEKIAQGEIRMGHLDNKICTDLRPSQRLRRCR